MIKTNQPFVLELSISTTTVLTGATSCYISYINPLASTGVFSSSVLDSTAAKITYTFTTGILSVDGEWRLTPYIKLSDGIVYPCETYEINVVNEFSTD